MRKTLQLIAAGFLMSASFLTAAEHTVVANGLSFTPKDLTINVGDTVTWRNDGGVHNVVDRGGSFRCANGCDGQGGNGDPSGAAWQFSLTFNSPETINYICDVHESLGMVGSVTVVGGGGGEEPGNLRFSAATAQVQEGDGAVTLFVNRIDGDDGAVSVQFATSNGSAQAGSDYTAASGTLNWADGDDSNKSFTITVADDSDVEAAETINVSLSNPGGGAGLGSPSTTTVTINDNDEPPVNQPGTLSFTAASTQVGEASGSATIQVARAQGNDGAVSVDYTTADGSAQAGSDYNATNGTLAWTDGDSANKSFTVPILDDSEEEGDETINVMLSSQTGGAALGTSSATLTIQDDEVAACAADNDTLCLNQGGRFQVEVEWRDFEGNTGRGQAVDIGRRDSGLIYFFDEDNIEMLLKVLDACVESLGNKFWVFYAATTNVEFTVTVTDTQTDEVKTYSNVLGNPAAPVLDTAAFDTCP